ncbi:glycosyltransferase [Candidatus Dojkabacteria bacterium]|nr:glycosyltransferase [Candidatus Dojkabacteria bacterium]
MKVALVHDWLVGMGGAERCLECFCEIFPNADIYTLIHKEGSVNQKIEGHRIHTSFLQNFPFSKSNYRYLYALMPTAIEQFDFRDYDLVISGSSVMAKGAIVPSHIPHISYIYSPMRYAWEMYPEYFGAKSYLPFWQRLVIPPLLNYIRMWDVVSTNRVDYLIADSKVVADRIDSAYKRRSIVIYPPVNVDFFEKEDKKEDYYLMVTSFEPNKRVDIAIEAFNELGLPLKVVGDRGRFLKRFRRQANSNIEFLGKVTDHDLKYLYSKAKATVFPGIDDFGIAPVESIASGTPVITFAAGGVTETVIPANPKIGKSYRSKPNGIYFYQPTAHSLVDAIRFFQKFDRTKGWDRESMRKYSERFSQKEFLKKTRKYFKDSYYEFMRNRLKAKVYQI